MSHVVLSIHIGIARLHRGELGVAWANLSEAISYMAKVEPGDRQLCGGAEMEVPVLAYAARVRVVQGFLDEAEALVKLSLAIAEKMDHAPTLAWALQMAAWIATVKGEFEQAAQMSLRVLEISDELGIKTRSATGTFYRGYALVATGGHAEGASLLHAGYSQWATFGGKFHCTEYAAYAANVLVDAGLREEALKFVLLGEKVQEESDERFFQAELLRLRGRLCELDGNGLAAADCYRRSIDAAVLQGAKLLSLRAATNLAGLPQSIGRGGEGLEILQSTYGRFGEGFDFPDLIKARSILQSL